MCNLLRLEALWSSRGRQQVAVIVRLCRLTFFCLYTTIRLEIKNRKRKSKTLENIRKYEQELWLHIHYSRRRRRTFFGGRWTLRLVVGGSKEFVKNHKFLLLLLADFIIVKQHQIVSYLFLPINDCCRSVLSSAVRELDSE